MGKSCCPPGVSEITMMNIGGNTVGMIAVGRIFQKLYKAGKKPEDITEEEILSEFSTCNYIPPEAHNEYGEALMKEFKKYCDKMAK